MESLKYSPTSNIIKKSTKKRKKICRVRAGEMSSSATSWTSDGIWSGLYSRYGGGGISDELLWRENRDTAIFIYGLGTCYATLLVLVFVFLWHSFKFLFLSSSSTSRVIITTATAPSKYTSLAPSPSRIDGIITDADLETLIKNLDGTLSETLKWDNVTERSNNSISYNAKCCKPKDGPLKYLSATVFENCSTEMLRDFYMDNDYRKQWDKTIVDHVQLQVDEASGTEIGCTIKKFPLLTPREYILAWRLWEGKDKTFYCFIRECEHPSVPKQKKYVRIGYFRSGWRIKKVPGRNACEIKMVHQEDAGLNVEMAKLAFAKGIWSYVCKMDNALRKYSSISNQQSSSSVTAVTLIQKVPRELDVMTSSLDSVASAVSDIQDVTNEVDEKKLSRKPSKKMLANGLLLLGGVVLMSRCHPSLGAKVAMAYILNKLKKRGALSSTDTQS